MALAHRYSGRVRGVDNTNRISARMLLSCFAIFRFRALIPGVKVFALKLIRASKKKVKSFGRAGL